MKLENTQNNFKNLQLTIILEAKKDLFSSIKLSVNQRLYDDGHISQELYEKAKEVFLKDE